MNDLSAFERDALYVTAGLDDPTGVRIRDALETYYGTPVNPGRLYPALDRLDAMGFIRKAPRDGRSNTYTLADRGHREILARRRWEHRYGADHPTPTATAEA